MENLLQYKILLVDDKPENLFSLAAVLKNAGYTSDSALSGKAALELLLKNKYGLMILDVQMPEMNGFELAEMIKGNSLTKDIPLLFLSANATDKEYYKKGHEAGALDYLTKPVDVTLLLLKTRNFLRQNHSRILLEKLNSTLEKKAAQANVSYQDLYNSLPQEIFLINKEGIVVNINRRNKLVCGLTPSQLLNEHYSQSQFLKEIFGKDSIDDIFKSIISDSIEQRIVAFKIQKNKNELFYGEATITLAVIHGGFHIQVSITDVTDKTEAQRKLKLNLNEMSLSEKTIRAALNDDSIEIVGDKLLKIFDEFSGIESGRIYFYEKENKSLKLISEKVEQGIINKIENKIGIKLSNVIPSLTEGSVFSEVVKNKQSNITSDPKEINEIIKAHSTNVLIKNLSSWAEKFIDIKTFGILPIISNDILFGIMTFSSHKTLSEMEKQSAIRFSRQISTVLSKKISELELKKSEERFELAMKGANDGLWDWNLTNDEVYYSPRWKSMLGLEENESSVETIEWEKLIHKEDKIRVLEILYNYVDGRIPEYNVEFRMRHKDGHYVDILARGIGVKGENGKFIRMLGTHIDITERKKIENELQQSELEIRNFAKHLDKVLEDERTNLAREIHDELGQQLAGIKYGISSFKKMIAGNSTGEAKITDILTEVDGTIQNLRKIATELRPGILDTLGLAASLEWLLKEFSKKTKIQCKVELDINERNFDKDISTCFFRICQETLSNIAKHADASEINVHLLIEEEILILTIKDNGKGMILNKLDNPFSMGLLGMKERAAIIGGHLEITSELGKGTKIKTFVNLNLSK